jgi:hypothetical protein
MVIDLISQIGQFIANLLKNAIAGIQVFLFFFVGFLLLGENIFLSLLLAILGGIAGGWISVGLASTEEAQEEPTPEPVGNGNSNAGKMDLAEAKTRFREWRNKHYNQARPSWMFWKNPRRSSKLRR